MLPPLSAIARYLLVRRSRSPAMAGTSALTHSRNGVSMRSLRSGRPPSTRRSWWRQPIASFAFAFVIAPRSPRRLRALSSARPPGRKASKESSLRPSGVSTIRWPFSESASDARTLVRRLSFSPGLRRISACSASQLSRMPAREGRPFACAATRRIERAWPSRASRSGGRSGSSARLCPDTLRNACPAASSSSFDMSSITTAPGTSGGTPRIVATSERPRTCAASRSNRSASLRSASNTVSALSKIAATGCSPTCVSRRRKRETSSPVAVRPSALTIRRVALAAPKNSSDAKTRRSPKWRRHGDRRRRRLQRQSCPSPAHRNKRRPAREQCANNRLNLDFAP